MSRTHDTNECPWENGQLGLSAEHAVAANPEFEIDVDDALELRPISIRLPKSLIDDMKLIAQKEGLGYQPLMRRVLLRFAAAEFRSMAHEELQRSLRKSESPAPPPMRAACGG